MAPRPFWKGYLKLSLVTCPVAMTPAIDASASVRFHTVNKKTGNRVESRYVDAETGDVVEDEGQVKGFEEDDGTMVMLEDDEIDAVALESTHTIDIDRFVPADSIGPLWRDRPHFLMPDDEIGEEAFGVIRAAMEESGQVGISRLVLYRRERSVLLEPRGKGLVLWTLRYGDEVRDADDAFADVPAARTAAAERKMMEELIRSHQIKWSKVDLGDPMEKKLRDLISSASRKKPRKSEAGAEKPAAPATEKGGKVISIMDALRQSLEGKGKSGKRS